MCVLCYWIASKFNIFLEAIYGFVVFAFHCIVLPSIPKIHFISVFWKIYLKFDQWFHLKLCNHFKWPNTVQALFWFHIVFGDCFVKLLCAQLRRDGLIFQSLRIVKSVANDLYVWSEKWFPENYKLNQMKKHT